MALRLKEKGKVVRPAWPDVSILAVLLLALLIGILEMLAGAGCSSSTVTATGGAAASTTLVGPPPSQSTTLPASAVVSGRAQFPPWHTIALTAGERSRYQPDTDGHYVVWEGSSPKGREIFLYDLTSGETTQLTDDAIDQYAPQVAGALVLWLEPRADHKPGMKLLLHDLADGSTVTLAEGRDVGQNVGDRPTVLLTERLLVWSAGGEIYAMDTAGRQTQRLSDGNGRNNAPDTDGYNVVWERQVAAGGKSEILLYSAVGGMSGSSTPVVIGEPSVGSDGPVVAEGVAAWTDFVEGSGYEVFAVRLNLPAGAEGSTPERLTFNRLEEHGLTAVAWGGRRVAWVEGQPTQPFEGAIGAMPGVSSPPTSESPVVYDLPASVVVYDLDRRQRTVLADGVPGETTVRLSGTLAAWAIPYGGDAGVHVHEFETDTTTQLARDASFDPRSISLAGVAQVSEPERAAQLVWADYRRDHQDIMLAARGPEPVPPRPAPPKDPFVDMAGSAYEAAAARVGVAGVMDGYQTAEGLEFRPEASLPRAQAAKAVFVALGLEFGADSASGPFADLGPVNPTSPYPHSYVNSLAARGIIRGTGSTSFSPWKPMTRRGLAVLLVRGLRQAHPETVALLPVGYRGTLLYQDPLLGDEMLVAQRNGLLTGLVGFRFNWDGGKPVTRGEAAQMLSNALKLIGEGQIAANAPAGGEEAKRVGDPTGSVMALPAYAADRTGEILSTRLQDALPLKDLRITKVEVSPTGSDGLYRALVVFTAQDQLTPVEAGRALLREGGVAPLIESLNQEQGLQIAELETTLDLKGAELARLDTRWELDSTGLSIRALPEVGNVLTENMPRPAPSPAD